MNKLPILAACLSAAAAHGQTECPSEREVRNLEVSASSVTAKPAERAAMQQQVRLARACLSGPEALAAEQARILSEGASAQRRQEIRDELQRCRFDGQLWGFNSVSGFIRCRK